MKEDNPTLAKQIQAHISTYEGKKIARKIGREQGLFSRDKVYDGEFRREHNEAYELAQQRRVKCITVKLSA